MGVARIRYSRLTTRCCFTSGNKQRNTKSALMRPTLASQCLRLAEQHKHSSTYTKRIITFYCTSEAGTKLLDKRWLNYRLMIKGFTGFSSAVRPNHHRPISCIFPLHHFLYFVLLLSFASFFFICPPFFLLTFPQLSSLLSCFLLSFPSSSHHHLLSSATCA